MPKKYNIILGSSSPGRQEVLSSAGYTFTVMAPDINEKAIRHPDPYQLPLLIAREKARAIKEKAPPDNSIVIVADQIVVFDRQLREKPTSRTEATEFLRSYSKGDPVESVSALVVFNMSNGKQSEGIDRSEVVFNYLPVSLISQCLDDGFPFENSGGFAIEHPLLRSYVNLRKGSMSSVRGLPMTLLQELIEQVK